MPRLIVKAGDPAREIIELVEGERIDLVVMGTHGLGGYRKMFFGSVTERVLRRASVPVLAVPVTEFPSVQFADESPVMAIGRVMAPLDLTAAPERAAEAAALVARSFAVLLLLVHVVAPIHASSLWQEPLQAQQRIRLARAREHLERLAAALSRDLVVDVRVELGRPADEIAAMAVESRAGLIVISLKGEGGGFAYRVLCLAQVPVLALPPMADQPSA